MIAGFDRYFQIAPCFRDEDARADRSPGEFYQLDIEMSFVTQEDVFPAVEPVLRDLFVEFADGKPVTESFPRIPYAEAMRKYGSDKPDLRNPHRDADVSDHFRGLRSSRSSPRYWRATQRRRSCAPSRRRAAAAALFCDRMNAWAQGEGQPGLGYIFFDARAGGRRARSPRTSARTHRGHPPAAPASNDGDAVFFVGRQGRRRSRHSPARRAARIGEELDLIDKDQFEFCWIVDFPMYRVERGREEGRLLAQPLLDAARRA